MFSRSLYVGTMTSARSALVLLSRPSAARYGVVSGSPDDVDPATVVRNCGNTAGEVEIHPDRDGKVRRELAGRQIAVCRRTGVDRDLLRIAVRQPDLPVVGCEP